MPRAPGATTGERSYLWLDGNRREWLSLTSWPARGMLAQSGSANVASVSSMAGALDENINAYRAGRTGRVHLRLDREQRCATGEISEICGAKIVGELTRFNCSTGSTGRECHRREFRPANC